MKIATTKALYSKLTAARVGAAHPLVANDSEGNMANIRSKYNNNPTPISVEKDFPSYSDLTDLYSNHGSHSPDKPPTLSAQSPI